MKYRNRIPEPGTTISGFADRGISSLLLLEQVSFPLFLLEQVSLPLLLLEQVSFRYSY